MRRDLIEDMINAVGKGEPLPPPFTGIEWDPFDPMPEQLKAKLIEVLNGYFYAGIIPRHGRYIDELIHDVEARFVSAEKRFIIEFGNGNKLPKDAA
ncbi:hypothetical protein MR829_22925 [Paracoccus versutus]|uniref:hypothetical protein n=1 Tax=Paracoccus versutus TaxID=34007 RepID=UPI001FB5E43D|nr:hypothetical protein [Paracoccus versutus]MCJ1903186.1 hypothetical protein [Paracoccus versutus]